MTRSRALVCSGGGAYGAYEVGVARALAEGRSPATGYQPLEPEVLTGTSVGAYNAAFLAAHRGGSMARAAADLEAVWLERISDHGDGVNGVFRYRFNPFELFDPFVVARRPLRTVTQFIEDGVTLTRDALQRLVWFFSETDATVPDRLVGLFDLAAVISTDPMLEMIWETIDFEALRGSSRHLTIATTEWLTGTLELVHGRDMTQESGPVLIRGSASIPGIFPPQQIGDYMFVDGGVLLNAPLWPATVAGARVVHVINPFPELKRVPLRTLASTIGAMDRAQTSAWDSTTDYEIRQTGMINLMIEGLMKIRRRHETLDIPSADRDFLKDAVYELHAKILRTAGHDQECEIVEVHRFHPREALVDDPLGMLLFERDRIEEYIEAGRRSAVEHDCARAGCVVPDAVMPDAVVPDAVVPDAVVPDAVMPDAEVPS